nr:preprotein translocase subunit YajC [Propionicimonas sp.]
MGGDVWSTVLMFALAGGVLYFVMIRPQQRRQKEQQNLMSSLAPGSRVMLISGIIGTVKYLGDKQAIVEISPGVEMTVDKRAISPQAVEDEFEYADDDAEAGDESAPAEPQDVPVVDETVYQAPTTVVDPAPVEAPEPTDTDVTWDQPGTDKH